MFANSIVDVKCIDEKGQQFIIEMQMIWTDSFKSRVLFNASKAYIKQGGRKIQYKSLQPVYSRIIIHENFDNKPDIYIHHYQLIHTQDSEDVMEGLEFVFIELPKFQAKKFTDKKLHVLWLHFLSEIEDLQEGLSPDFLDVPELREASELILESALTRGELETYDRYWDIINTEKSFKADAYDKGVEKGMEKGIVKEKTIIARNLKILGLSNPDISKTTGLSEQETEKLGELTD